MKPSVDATCGTPSPTCSTSAAIVPKTLTISAAVQQAAATWRRTRSWTTSAPTSASSASGTTTSGGKRFTRKSEVVSPIPVVSTFTTQNAAVTAGRRLSRAAGTSGAGGVMPSCSTARD